MGALASTKVSESCHKWRKIYEITQEEDLKAIAERFPKGPVS
jgi:predicted transcriptional regulator